VDKAVQKVYLYSETNGKEKRPQIILRASRQSAEIDFTNFCPRRRPLQHSLAGVRRGSSSEPNFY